MPVPVPDFPLINQPALVPTCTSLGAQHAPFYGAGPAEAQPVDWYEQGCVLPSPLRRAILPTLVSPNPIVLTTPDIVKLTWQPEHQDWIARRRTFHAGWVAMSLFASFPPPVLYPSATYVDWMPRKAQTRFPTMWSVMVPDTIMAEAWLTHYPAAVSRSVIPTASMPSTWLGSFGTISIPGLSWLGHQPSWHVQPRFKLFNIEANIEPIPMAAAPENSWQPMFADFATRADVHASNVPSSWWNTITPPPMPVDWQMQHQMPVRRVLRPAGGMTTGFDIVAAWPEAWYGSYPNFINTKLMPQRPTLFNAPQSTQISIQTFGWWPQMPSFYAKPQRPAWAMMPFNVEPSIIADVYDCIELVDSDVYGSTLYSVTVHSSGLTDETLTPTSPNEEYC